MYIKETTGTNTLLKENYLNKENFFFIRAGFQTAGRGQAGNVWESEADKNLLFSVLLKNPPIPIESSFRLSMATSLSIVDALKIDEVRIKWPNDIYYEDKKLGGILIENIISYNAIRYSIIGVGLNINQIKWSVSVPNPISMAMITGHPCDIDEIFAVILESLKTRMRSLEEPKMKEEYMGHLFWREGLHRYRIRENLALPNTPIYDKGNSFMASIVDVNDSGQIILCTEEGIYHTFHFKQIAYVFS